MKFSQDDIIALLRTIANEGEPKEDIKTELSRLAQKICKNYVKRITKSEKARVSAILQAAAFVVLTMSDEEFALVKKIEPTKSIINTILNNTVI